MKRSEINRIMQDAIAFLAEKQFILPPWAYWNIDDWKQNKDDAGEVSIVNDDKSDNCFYEEVGRFPPTLEDVAPLYLLVSDYEKFL